ncbi:TA system VapC family ribonuclease toxin [Sphingomonas sp. 10B4]|uniref:TA system VapC family ribonuclease toxin n=1 Tax=Sphingomonas sp. 10B4 TaxID=3048575 RepID=UPI002AB38917|nr:TA system VapC family ribonuclease toxin [Sphingomonas sp. 10B4]MDY7522740.1 PIN domain-containing protein [Sphingomonas sp. 10B4]MEB0284482.1 PIN domain-containing protein [Sphingomonas sp. 10B4]
MTYLLDVNVLIALIDRRHVNHDVAHRWFSETGHAAWATCPLTENGVLRIVGHPRYANTPGSPAAVVPVLASLCALPGHVFWPDAISLLDEQHVTGAKLFTSAQLTDTYLLALAASRHGKLATLDSRVAVQAVPGGKASLHVIATQ